jgi:response regulator of citrate/malate metabolism
MGRPIGSRDVSVQQIKEIVELTQDELSRPDIAEEVGVSARTVWRYQNDFDLI